MAANPVSDFDLGPLTWVKTEIDHSLNQARENLDKLLANPADRSVIKYILTHLHQATGALAMVGLGAATRFNEELGEVELFEFREVVEEVTDKNAHISLVDAKEFDPDAEIGDEIGVKVDTSRYGRILAQTAKQVIIQRIREA